MRSGVGGFVVTIFAVVGTLPARDAVACELLTLPTETGVVHVVCLGLFLTAQLCSINRSTKSDGPSSFSSTSTSCVPSGASDTVACHARRERESAEVAKAAAQLLSREPRVFTRPNVRSTLVAIEKAARHSVSLFTIIMWGARSRFKAFQAHLAELLDRRDIVGAPPPRSSQ